MKGFILAGGEGTRLRPITYEIPKPLLPVKGIPVLSYLITLYLKNNIKEIKINIQEENEKKFVAWKNKYFPQENISFLVEKEPSGTLTPILKTKKWFSSSVVVSNGDELKNIDIKKLTSFHKKCSGLATIGLIKVKNPKNYGVVDICNNKIEKFTEKPKNPTSNFINSGIYVLEPEIKKIAPLKKFSMLEKNLFPKLAKNGLLYGYRWEGKWQDIGTFERWEEAIKNW